MASVYRAVDEHYTNASLNNDLKHSERVANAFGYTSAELATIPINSHLGLSCGNPLATSKLKEGETFLDLGSGGGLDVFLASKRVGPSGKCIGVDMNDQMLDLARRNMAQSDHKNVEFIKGLVTALPVQSSSVDIVSSNCVINLVPEEDKPTVFTEIYRVLRPGGRLAISDILLKKPFPDAMKNDMSLYAACIVSASALERYQNWMLAAGFSRIMFVDTQKDLNIHKSTAESGRVCCGGSKRPVQCEDSRTLDLNQYISAYQIYALKAGTSTNTLSFEE